MMNCAAVISLERYRIFNTENIKKIYSHSHNWGNDIFWSTKQSFAKSIQGDDLYYER
jgi:hypothetical protein